jgi:hypothetical protein
MVVILQIEVKAGQRCFNGKGHARKSIQNKPIVTQAKRNPEGIRDSFTKRWQTKEAASFNQETGSTDTTVICMQYAWYIKEVLLARSKQSCRFTTLQIMQCQSSPMDSSNMGRLACSDMRVAIALLQLLRRLQRNLRRRTLGLSTVHWQLPKA